RPRALMLQEYFAGARAGHTPGERAREERKGGARSRPPRPRWQACRRSPAPGGTAGRPASKTFSNIKAQSRFAIGFLYVIMRALCVPGAVGQPALGRCAAREPESRTMPLTIGVLKETLPGETRVALTPEVTAKLIKA